MERTQRIVDRLPSFYTAWDPDSVMYKFIDAFGRGLAEPHKDLGLIIRSHWVDTAFGADLDKLGSIFELARHPNEADEDYRTRIKSAVRSFKGGGTRDAIITLVGLYLGVKEGQGLELVENPASPLGVTKRVVSGDSWSMGSMGVDDATPEIELGVEGDGLEILDPVLSSPETGELLKFKGRLKSGQKLVLKETSARLDGVDAGKKVAAKPFPRLRRGGSTWQFDEALSVKVARFDKSSFDDSIFEVPLPTTTIRFSWTGRLPATFELKVSAAALKRNGLTKEDLEAFVNVIKGAGVMAIVSPS
jgi:hypothetical protein